jgi:hypothetical protein
MAKGTNTTSRARTVASEGKDVRDRVKDLTMRAIRDRGLAMKEVSKVVGEVLHGASQGLKDAVPQSQKSVLRQVFNGLEEAVETTAKAGLGAAKSVQARGERVIKRDAPAAARQVREANNHFLTATSTFARKLSGEMKEELKELVARARRTGPKVGSAARAAAKAADGRLMELGGETVRAGTTVARRTIGGVMMATGGMMEGIAESINPKPKSAAVKPARKKTRSARKD